ncbi:MAG: hypothetical protein V8S01_05810 [Dorea sp.]
MEEEQKLIKQAWLDYENKPEVTTPLAVILLFYLGLRVGEVVALREADIKDDRLIVRRTESRSFKTENEVDYMQSGRYGCRTYKNLSRTQRNIFGSGCTEDC